MKTFKNLILLIAIFISTIAFSQQVGVTVLRDKCITTAQRNSIVVTAGEQWKICNSDTGKNEFWNGTSWEEIVSASGLPTEFINGDGTFNTFITVTQAVDLDVMESDTNTNNAKNTNVSTNLSEGTVTNTTVDVNSSDGTNATLVAASTSRAGVMTKAKFDEVVINNSKNTNVTTDISFSRTSTTLTIISSDGNDAILPEADTSNSGLLGSDKWDEIVDNTSKISLETGSVTKAKLATELKTKVALGDVSGVVNIDASLGIHYTMNMTGNVTNLTFTNLTNEELKTITLEITSDGGSYTFFQPTSIKGDWSAFDSTLTNQIQIYMYDISTPLFTSGFFNF